jgi:CO/xanthine dehydrogenase Mo-binding subunit
MTTTHERTATGAGALETPEIRVDGRGKVSGATKYTADVHRPNVLWAAYARSPYAYARIRRIDTTAAREVPGVKAVLTWHDIGKLRFGRQLFDWPVLCWDVVRFIGDRVAVVAAETQAAADAAAALVEVEYEELEPMLTPADALAPNAPVLHPEWHDYRYLAYLDTPKPRHPHPNMQARTLYEKGDRELEPIFASAHRVFEHRFETPRQHCGYLEPHATLVWLDDDGTVHVHTPNKSPFALRSQLATVLGIPAEKIVVEINAIGGDFGGKGLTLDEYPCYFLAKATGRPVRHVQRYADELQTVSTRHAARITLRTAVDEHGKFLAHHAEAIYNGGAYAAPKVVPDLFMGGFGTVGYHIPNVRLELINVYTNTIPGGHMRSPSDVQTFFAWEQHIDIIARELRIDPLEMRMLNVMRVGQTAVTDEPMKQPIGFEVLATLKRELAAAPEPPPGAGRGIAFVCRHTGQGKTAMDLRFDADGVVRVLTGNPDQGSGGHTVIARVIAATLGIDPARVEVRRGTTGETLLDPGTGASRVTHVTGSAAKDGAEKLKAALEARSGMTIAVDRFVDPNGGASRSIEEVAREICGTGPIAVVGTYDGDFHHVPGKPGDYSFSAYAIDVDLDVDTGAVKVRNALLVVDVAQIINPVAHQGQIDGGFIYGIGGALMEEIPIDDKGRPQTPSLNDYKLPTIMDIPPFRTVHVPAPGGWGPFGAKMAGELSNSGVAPAIVNAIYDAAGVRIPNFPVTAERVFDALTAAGRR